MKQLTDLDIENMIGENDAATATDDKDVRRSVRCELRLGTLIPKPAAPVPTHVVIDLHQKTEDEAWREINAALHSGARTATIITGASGILKPKFQQWVTDSIITPYITSCKMLNRGSFFIRIKKLTSDM